MLLIFILHQSKECWKRTVFHIWTQNRERYNIELADHFDDDFTIECVQQAITSYHNHPSITYIWNKCPNPKNFSFKKLHVDNVLRNMTNVNTNKSTGYDNISQSFIKIAVNEPAWPITNIINHCIVNNHYPDSYKRAETSPLYKAKDRYCKDNYTF